MTYEYTDSIIEEARSQTEEIQLSLKPVSLIEYKRQNARLMKFYNAHTAMCQENAKLRREIEECKQRMKGGPIKNTCTAEKIKIDTPDQIVFYPLMNQPLKQKLDSDTVILDGNREVTTPVKFTAYNPKEAK